MASITSNQQAPDSTASIDQKDLLSDTQDTLTSVTSNFDGPDSERVTFAPQDALVQEENKYDEEGNDGDGDISGERADEENQEVDNGTEELSEAVVAKQTVQDESVLGEGASLPLVAASDEDEVPSAEESQKAFDNIMELLNVVDKSDTATAAEPSFEEFTELLSNPDKLQERERELQVMDEIVNPPEGVSPPEGPATPKEDAKEPSEVVTSAFASSTSASFPDVVKPATYQELLPNVTQEVTETKELEIATSNGAEAEWPDIGAAEVPTGLDESVQPHVVVAAPNGVQNEVYIEDNEPPDVGLLMPSALTDMPVEVPNIGPDLLEQEAPTDSKLALENEEGAAKVRSRSRKRSKKKKQTGAMTSVGVAEVIDVLRYWEITVPGAIILYACFLAVILIVMLCMLKLHLLTFCLQWKLILRRHPYQARQTSAFLTW